MNAGEMPRALVRGALTAALGCGLLCASPAEAHGRRNAYFGFGVGAGIKMVKSISQLKIAQELGVHLSGGSSGFAVALGLAESFGDDLVTFQAGPKLVWDIPVVRRFYVAPSVQAGYGLRAPQGGEADHFFNTKVALELKVLPGGRVLIFFQPFGLDMYFTDPFWMRYDLLGGLGLVF
jgi:hypothetical protein